MLPMLRTILLHTPHHTPSKLLQNNPPVTCPERLIVIPLKYLWSSHFHFCTTTPPRLNSAMSPRTCALSVSSLEGNVVMSA
jgi:hypothetical protein